MLDRRRHQERDREGGEQQRDEVDVALEVVDVAEARRERDGEQEREEHLHAGKHDPQLLQELVEVAVEALLLGLGLGLGHDPATVPIRSRSQVMRMCTRTALPSTCERTCTRSQTWFASHSP